MESNDFSLIASFYFDITHDIDFILWRNRDKNFIRDLTVIGN